jgi:hypothetical protein
MAIATTAYAGMTTNRTSQRTPGRAKARQYPERLSTEVALTTI